MVSIYNLTPPFSCYSSTSHPVSISYLYNSIYESLWEAERTPEA